jgi:hypothetical protein
MAFCVTTKPGRKIWVIRFSPSTEFLLKSARYPPSPETLTRTWVRATSTGTHSSADVPSCRKAGTKGMVETVFGATAAAPPERVLIHGG